MVMLGGGSVSSLPPAEDQPDLEELFRIDPYLKPQEGRIRDVFELYRATRHRLGEELDGYEASSRGHQSFGAHVQEDNSIRMREWAPNLKSLTLAGEFNNWNTAQHPFHDMGQGIWELVLPPTDDGSIPIPHLTDIRLFCVDLQGQTFDRISPWARYATQGGKDRVYYNETFYHPGEGYPWRHTRPKPPRALYIYEAHVGISSPEPKISSYYEFASTVIPRIADLGYNCIQMMAVMEHAYYASFGYQVTSFFAPSSRYGTPDELRYLIDTAHSHGIVVLLDLVHSHASNNTKDGLSMFDGSDSHFFVAGESGRHSQWNSRLFDYHKTQTLQFLLSNLRYWMEEFRFDGFRFDGVTSMLYHHHGICHTFGGYPGYFDGNLNMDAVVYMMLANDLLHQEYPNVVTIAEDVSGYPGLCLPVRIGGVGFDYRLAMSVPDMWIKLLKESKSDAEWDMGHIAYTLNNRRYREKTIAYVESHDQALVGDKTIAFWLMDKEMYTNMSVLTPLTSTVERGLALHKLLRLITFSLGGEAILTFMGNEFGHPEWLDFPRAGNNESYQYARRQYNLVDDELLRYRFLHRFDGFILSSERENPWLDSPNAYIHLCHEGDKVISYERAGLCFVFNFFWESYTDYPIRVGAPGKYTVVMDTDHKYFGGHGRVDPNTEYFSYEESDKIFIKTYLPSRTALVYRIVAE